MCPFNWTSTRREPLHNGSLPTLFIPIQEVGTGSGTRNGHRRRTLRLSKDGGTLLSQTNWGITDSS